MLSLSILTITVIVDIIANCEEQQTNMQISALSSQSTGFVETETSAISVIKAYGIPIWAALDALPCSYPTWHGRHKAKAGVDLVGRRGFQPSQGGKGRGTLG